MGTPSMSLWACLGWLQVCGFWSRYRQYARAITQVTNLHVHLWVLPCMSEVACCNMFVERQLASKKDGKPGVRKLGTSHLCYNSGKEICSLYIGGMLLLNA